MLLTFKFQHNYVLPVHLKEGRIRVILHYRLQIITVAIMYNMWGRVLSVLLVVEFGKDWVFRSPHCQETQSSIGVADDTYDILYHSEYGITFCNFCRMTWTVCLSLCLSCLNSITMLFLSSCLNLKARCEWLIEFIFL